MASRRDHAMHYHRYRDVCWSACGLTTGGGNREWGTSDPSRVTCLDCLIRIYMWQREDPDWLSKALLHHAQHGRRASVAA